MKKTAGVIFDLDGTLLDTETACFHISQKLVSERYGKQLTKEIALLAIGKRPLESWEVVREQLDLPATAEELLELSEPLLREKLYTVKALPGVQRLLRHLAKHSIPIAVATSTPRASYNIKMQTHAELVDCIAAAVCGEEVDKGKPAPDTFLKAAKVLGIEPSQCLAFEDAPSGIQSATAAGMTVVAVPSMLDETAYKGCECTFLPSLLAFNPTDYGLPAFDDLVEETVPLDPVWRLKGPVVKGFGRGSRRTVLQELGIPTANLSAESIGGALCAAVTGIYYGWASIGNESTTYQMVMSVGFNPFYHNKTKTCEPWILHEFTEDFYGKDLRLIVCGYIRPEAGFSTLEHLKARILEDARVARQALKDETMLKYSEDAFLNPAAE